MQTAVLSRVSRSVNERPVTIGRSSVVKYPGARRLEIRERTVARRDRRIADDLESLRRELAVAIRQRSGPSDPPHARECTDLSRRVVVELHQATGTWDSECRAWAAAG